MSAWLPRGCRVCTLGFLFSKSSWDADWGVGKLRAWQRRDPWQPQRRVGCFALRRALLSHPPLHCLLGRM
jgi:hypothetical protein